MQKPTIPRIRFDSSLSPGQTLYRYISVESFVAFVETGETSLTKVTSWEDSWEAILAKIPTVDEQGGVRERSYSYVEDLFGQCWSLLPESDALWRIYSPNKTGMVIATSVERFQLLAENYHHLHVGRVVYFDDVQDLVSKAEAMHNHPFPEALLKRSAFAHEHEVRLLMLAAHQDKVERTDRSVTLRLDPAAFLTGVTIDPRAPDWFVRAVELYCLRAGLSVKPVRSTLYNSNPESTLGLARRWVPVKQEPKGSDPLS